MCGLLFGLCGLLFDFVGLLFDFVDLLFDFVGLLFHLCGLLFDFCGLRYVTLTGLSAEVSVPKKEQHVLSANISSAPLTVKRRVQHTQPMSAPPILQKAALLSEEAKAQKVETLLQSARPSVIPVAQDSVMQPAEPVETVSKVT